MSKEPPDDDVIVLADEEGNEREFTIVPVFTVDEQDYATLLPRHWEEEIGEAVLLRIDQENGEDVLVEIEDEAELSRVAKVLDELIEAEYEGEEEVHD